MQVQNCGQEAPAKTKEENCRHKEGRCFQDTGTAKILSDPVRIWLTGRILFL